MRYLPNNIDASFPLERCYQCSHCKLDVDSYEPEDGYGENYILTCENADKCKEVDREED